MAAKLRISIDSARRRGGKEGGAGGVTHAHSQPGSWRRLARPRKKFTCVQAPKVGPECTHCTGACNEWQLRALIAYTRASSADELDESQAGKYTAGMLLALRPGNFKWLTACKSGQCRQLWHGCKQPLTAQGTLPWAQTQLRGKLEQQYCCTLPNLLLAQLQGSDFDSISV